MAVWSVVVFHRSTTPLTNILTHAQTYIHVHTHTQTYIHMHTHTFPVYTQTLSHILQVVCGPLMQLLEEEIERNKTALQRLASEKEQLQTVLSEHESTAI